MLISLDALQILDAIDTRGSFAAAADALHRVPSALTHAIRKLEDDLAIGAPGDMPPGGGYRTQVLGRSQPVFAVAPSHPLAKMREPIAAAALLKHRAVVIADTSRQLLARTAGLLSGQDTLVVPDFAAKLAAQAAGLGVGHLPLPLAAPEIAAGRLVAKRTTEATPDLPLHIAWRSDHEGLALSWFLERLGDEALRARLLGEAPKQRATRAARRPSR